MVEEPDGQTTYANHHLRQPTQVSHVKRKEYIKKTVQQARSQTKDKKDKHNSSGGEVGRAPSVKGIVKQHSSGSSLIKSNGSQAVGLAVDDREADEVKKVAPRKDETTGWNAVEPTPFV